MSDQFWLTKAQLKRIEPFFHRTRGIPRVDDRRVVSGIIYVIRNGLRWRDAPAVYGRDMEVIEKMVVRGGIEPPTRGFSVADTTLWNSRKPKTQQG